MGRSTARLCPATARLGLMGKAQAAMLVGIASHVGPCGSCGCFAEATPNPGHATPKRGQATPNPGHASHALGCFERSSIIPNPKLACNCKLEYARLDGQSPSCHVISNSVSSSVSSSPSGKRNSKRNSKRNLHYSLELCSYIHTRYSNCLEFFCIFIPPA